MGYRPTFESVKYPELSFYGTKLFGYVDPQKLRSFSYLVSIGKLSEDVIFDYCFENEIVLSEKEFALFIDFYELDMQKCCNSDFSFNVLDNGIVRILVNTSGDKRVYWC